MIELPARDRIVNVAMFMVAMWAIARIGQPDFLVPGCRTLKRKLAGRRKHVRSLDLEYLRDSLEDCISELVLAGKLKEQIIQEEATNVAREAAKRMVESIARVSLPAA